MEIGSLLHIASIIENETNRLNSLINSEIDTIDKLNEYEKINQKLKINKKLLNEIKQEITQIENQYKTENINES